MNVGELVKYMEERMEFSSSESWDNTGLQIGDPLSPVRGIVTSMDLDEAAISFAIEKKANVMVVHHPILFYPLRRVIAGEYVSEMVRRCVREEISVIVTHTSGMQREMNRFLAEKIGLQHCETVGAYVAVGELPFANGSGAERMDPFFRRLKEEFGEVWCNRMKTDLTEVKKVALCSGAGGEFIELAKSCSDLYLTGELGYHKHKDAGMPVLTVGHFDSEKNYPIAAGRVLSELFEACRIAGCFEKEGTDVRIPEIHCHMPRSPLTAF